LIGIINLIIISFNLLLLKTKFILGKHKISLVAFINSSI